MRTLDVGGVEFHTHDALDADWLADAWQRVDREWLGQAGDTASHPTGDDR